VGLAVKMRSKIKQIKTQIFVGFLSVCLLLGAVQASTAQTDQKAFRVSIAGFPVGTASYSAAITGKRYEIQGFIGSTGFFGAFLASRYSGAVIGRTSGARLTPQIFRGSFQVFEGTRTSRIAMQRSQGDGGTVICNGVYTRLGGFTPEQMAERQNFPFQLVFHPTASGLFEVREFRATTFWGVAKAVLK